VTTVKWKTKSDTTWGECFDVGVSHPESYLCIAVLDDDPLFRRDTDVAWKRRCGWLQIPLMSLPRNKEVAGWFTLNHPGKADQEGGWGDQQKRQAQDLTKGGNDEDVKKKEGQDAGKVKLALRLDTTMLTEIRGKVRGPPTFEASLPQLNLPQFLEDVKAVKNILFGRLIMPPISSVLYALSWDDKLLSTALLLWWWFIFYHTRYLWASIWFLVALSFWHEIPEQALAREKTEVKASKSGIFSGTFKLVTNVGDAVGNSLLKPAQGAAKDGLRGFAVGLREGVVNAVAKTSDGVLAVGAGVKDTVSTVTDTVGSFGTPGLQTFQHILQVNPNLKNTICRYQPTVASTRASLQKVDNLFYWAVFETTKKAVNGIGVCFVLAVLFCGYMGAASWYCFFYLGSSVILAKCPAFKTLVVHISATVAYFTRPKEAFKGCAWFEPEPAE